MSRISNYRPTAKEQEAQTKVYKAVEDMIEVRNRTFRQFVSDKGNRTLVAFIDDNDRRVNGYTLTRGEQDKEDWQENNFYPTTRNKLKAIVAAVALEVPELAYKATDKNGMMSSKRAELIKQLVKHSRTANANPQIDIFFEAWECAVKGTVVKYDGYLKTKFKRKYIKSYDLINGDVEFDEREELVEDRPIDLLVPLVEFFIRDPFTFDVQDQPDVCWIKHYHKEDIEREFGQSKNIKYIRDKQQIARYKSDTVSYFYDKWANRVTEMDDYEVVRYYNKFEDQYDIWINGVPILQAPLLWGHKDKLYPFSKTIFEPFEGKQFFYGNSLANTLKGQQDIINTLYNSLLDKTYRALVPPMLVGLANKDLLDLEDEFVNQDNKIYVPDVNQVKPMPYESIQQGDIAMLEIVSRGIDLASVDANQQGVQGRGVTAREIVIADENARKLKGVFFMFLEDLWVQKTRIRIVNILTNYMKANIEKVVGPQGVEMLVEGLKIFNIPDVQFSDGSVGMLGVQVIPSPDERDAMRKYKVRLQKPPSVADLEVREQMMQTQGIDYKAIAVSSDYLDDWHFDFVVMLESLYNKDQAKKEAVTIEKLERMAAMFPEYLVANKDKMFEEFLEVYGDSADDFNQPAPLLQEGVAPAGSPLAQGAAALNPT